MILSPEGAERLVEILERPAVPLPEGSMEELEESLKRGKEWIANFSKESD
ncbi:MAG: hypothetical protein FWG64_12280 [Firmicutes bacterium]|nr:hypothetical protein [Bacillota bacterium]